jgi:[ribosomal protein S5]-alanine N-acetyltransferase
VEFLLSKSKIRHWQAGDLDELLVLANEWDIARNMRNRFPHPYKERDGRAWIEIANNEPVTNFAVEVKGKLAGGIGLMLQDDVYFRTAEIGYWLGKPYWGRGIATEAVIAMSEYAFAHYDLCRLEAGVFAWNPASARVLEKAGYSLEARNRKAVTKDGQTVDRLIYALVR